MKEREKRVKERKKGKGKKWKEGFFGKMEKLVFE